MATSRPFAYNPSDQIDGTLQFGSVAVGTPTSGVTGNPRWFNGPDEDLGYVIAIPVADGNQPVPDGSFASIGFYRSTGKTEESFIEISEIISFNENFTTGNEAYLWLSGNGYWSSWNYTTPTPTPTPTPNQGFSYSDFSSTVGLTAVGNASVVSNIYNLTTAGNGQVGNVYRTTAIQYNRNFSAQWSTFIGGGTGADGYCIQWTPTNNTNGSVGGGVGYLSTAINAITFLTYTNNNFTWYKNNVSQGATSVTSGFWRQTLYFWADYNHSAQTFALYWNTTNSKPGTPNQTYNSFSFDTGSYYMGFGAATGGANDNHQLINWTLTFT